MQPSVLAPDRHALELTNRPDGVDVAEQQNLARTGPESGHYLIADVRGRHARHDGAELIQPLARAAGRSGRPRLIVGRRLEGRQFLDELEEPVSCSLDRMHQRTSWGQLRFYNSARATALHALHHRHCRGQFPRCLAQTPQPFPRTASPAPSSPQAPAPAAPPPTAGAPWGTGPGVPTPAMLGAPVYPSCGLHHLVRRRPRPALLPVRHDRSVRRTGDVLQDLAEGQRRGDLRVPADASVRDGEVPGRDDGVCAERDDQGLHLRRIGGYAERQRRSAGTFSDSHPDCARSGGRQRTTANMSLLANSIATRKINHDQKMSFVVVLCSWFSSSW